MLDLSTIIFNSFLVIGILGWMYVHFCLICSFLQKQQTEVLLLCYYSMVPAHTKVSSVLVLFVKS